MGQTAPRGDLQNTHHEAGFELLSTKFAPPRLGSHFVPRKALLARLDSGLEQKLSLISTPAGFGKTTLVSDWLDHLDLPAAWLSLDEDDNDFARFWIYFTFALQTIQPEVGAEVLALLQSSPLPHSHTLLTLLINELAAISEQFILVLDDYHNIETKAIDQALTYFIEHIPPRMHLVMTSRVDPNLSLSRLRAQGQLNELRSTDLRFSQAETARFLEQMTGLNLTVAEVAALDRRTEGWIAGLQMAALSLQQRGAAAVGQFIEEFSGSHRYIMDYLVDEVLHGQPAEVQTFLLSTSILDQLCAPLCDAILPASEIPIASTAQDLLAHLEHANLFVTPLDDQRHWYRYHPLFASLLRQRLNQAYPDRVTGLHLSASQWYEQAGLTDSAVRHALAAQALDRAASLVEQVAPAMIQRSELIRLLTWVDTLPEDEVQARPRLALYYVQVLFLSGQITQAAAWLEAVEAGLVADETKNTPEVQAHTAAMRANLVRLDGDFAATIALSGQALAHLPEQDAPLRAMVTLNLAIAHYFQGEFERASELLTEIIAINQTAQVMATILFAIYLEVQLLRAQGALGRALQVCQEGLELVTRRGWRNFPAAGILYVTLGDLLRERNELSRAAKYLEKGIKQGQEGGHPHILITGGIWLGWLRLAQGDVTGSWDAIRAALQVVRQRQVTRFWPLPPADCYQARLWIAQGDLVAAGRWARDNGLDPADTEVTFFYEVEYLTLTHLLIAQGKLDAAETLLNRLHRGAAESGRNGSLIEILILQAITFAAQNRSEKALSALEQAFSLAEPEGFVRIFLDEGAPLVELLRQAVAQGLHTSYALQLLEAGGEAAVAPQPLIEPLSERELEVLRVAAAGYSNKEIAQELVIAVSTVKRHLSNIYGKLEVESRTQAVAKARELEIL
jgi:LuxR family maltose regulon positive regulatory protein